MNENLLQFIWKNRFFNKGPYHTIDGTLIEILNTGIHNFNQGPDFLNARIRIGKTEWAGNIELHIHASDWYKHEHENDPNFRNIILHVVWINDLSVFDQVAVAFPTLCIQPYISNLLLSRYADLMHNNPFSKPCCSFLPSMNHLKWTGWKERLVIERLERKANKICTYLFEEKQNWEMVSWWLLAANMGLKVNEHLFESVDRSISLKIIANHRNRIQQLEAILLGQANLLDETFEELYPQMLQKEYRFLQKKYRLEKQLIQPAFLRMRPASFPTLRLAQLAMLIQENDHLFDFFKNAENVNEVQKRLRVKPNDFWLYHYRFDDQGLFKEKRLGNSMVNSIIINTVIPLLFAYGLMMKEPIYQERAINWLMLLGAEKNRITNIWTYYQVSNQSAFDSQALLELNNCYCQEKRCLECTVGISILGNT